MRMWDEENLIYILIVNCVDILYIFLVGKNSIFQQKITTKKMEASRRMCARRRTIVVRVNDKERERLEQCFVFYVPLI